MNAQNLMQASRAVFFPGIDPREYNLKQNAIRCQAMTEIDAHLKVLGPQAQDYLFTLLSRHLTNNALEVLLALKECQDCLDDKGNEDRRTFAAEEMGRQAQRLARELDDE